MNILLFDTETTGLPRKFNDHPKDWPRLVSISWALQRDGKIFASCANKVKPDGFDIPAEATAVHGISTAQAQLFGFPLEEAIVRFGKAWKQADLVVCHNWDYDINIVDGEAWRLWSRLIFNDKPHFCTMKSTTGMCAGTHAGRSKYPKLVEIHRHLIGCDFKGAHDSSADMYATRRVFNELVRRGLAPKGIVVGAKEQYNDWPLNEKVVLDKK